MTCRLSWEGMRTCILEKESIADIQSDKGDIRSMQSDQCMVLLLDLRSREKVDHAVTLSTRTCLLHHQLTSFVGSLNWASCLTCTSLGHLQLRPLRQYFNSLELNEHFSRISIEQGRRVGPPAIVAILAGPAIPIHWNHFLTFQADMSILTEVPPIYELPICFFLNCGNLVLNRLPTPHQLCGVQGNISGTPSLDADIIRPGDYTQVGRDILAFLAPVRSDPLPVTTHTEHCAPSQTHTGLPQCGSMPVVLTGLAGEHSDSIPIFWHRLPPVGGCSPVSTVHNSQLPKFMADDVLLQPWQDR